MPYLSANPLEAAINPEESNGTFWQDVGNGLRNAWYNFTGQTEKTSYFKTLLELENSKNQRTAEDMAKAGLSKYGLSGGTAGTPSLAQNNNLPKSIQLAAAIQDLKKQKVGIEADQAGVRKTEAETGQIEAATAAQENENRTFDETHAAQMAKMASETAWNETRNEIDRQVGATKTEEIHAYIDNLVSQTAANYANVSYTQTRDEYQRGELYWQDEDHRSQIESRDAATRKSAQEVQNLRQEVKESAARIAHYAAQDLNLDAQTKKLVEETAYKMLEYNVLAYNFAYSYNAGLRTGDQPSRLFGINTQQLSGWLQNFINGSIGALVKWRQ